ncbi:MAG: single-stranded DNA-binding protein [Planctomycetes bacterium]|nr:single-stranded DNA-binding protein [Planctomycetota bacterium]
MANFNKVILAGNLTRDPQMSMLPSNTPVCEFGLATNRKWRAQNGEMREEVCFVDIRAFGKTAETISQYMAKGRSILVEGRLKFDQWEAKDGGGKRSKLYVVVDSFQFLGSPGGSNQGGSNQSGGGQNRSWGKPQAAPAHANTAPSDNYDEMPPVDSGGGQEGDNIPF